MSTAIGDLVVRINIDKKKFEIGIGSMEKNLRSMTDRVFDAQKAFISFGAKAAGGLAVAAAAVAAFNVRNQLAELDELEAKANAIGMNSGALAGLQHAAAMTNVDADKLTQGITILSKAVVDATAGSKGVSAIFEELGLNANELVKLSPDRMFIEVAEAIRQIENPAERMYATLKLFGKSGSELANVLSLGKEGMAGMQREAEALGLALSDTDMSKIAAANDELDKANESLRGMWRTLTVELAPAIANIAKIAAGMARDMNAVFGGKVNATRQSELAKQFQETQLGRPLQEGEAIDLRHWIAAGQAIQAMDDLSKNLATSQNAAGTATDSAATAATSYAAAVAKMAAETQAARDATKAATEAKRKEAELQRAILAEAERITKKEQDAQEKRLKPISDATDALDKWRSELDAMTTGLTDRQQQIAELEKSLRWSGEGAGAKTIENLKQLDKELSAADMNKEFQDPLQKYLERIKQIDEISRTTKLDEGVADKAKQAAFGEFAAAQKDFSFAGAMEKGSAGAYSTIVNAGKESDKIARAQLAVERVMAEGIRTIATKPSVEDILQPAVSRMLANLEAKRQPSRPGVADTLGAVPTIEEIFRPHVSRMLQDLELQRPQLPEVPVTRVEPVRMDRPLQAPPETTSAKGIDKSNQVATKAAVDSLSVLRSIDRKTSSSPATVSIPSG